MGVYSPLNNNVFDIWLTPGLGISWLSDIAGIVSDLSQRRLLIGFCIGPI